MVKIRSTNNQPQSAEQRTIQPQVIPAAFPPTQAQASASAPTQANQIRKIIINKLCAFNRTYLTYKKKTKTKKNPFYTD